MKYKITNMANPDEFKECSYDEGINAALRVIDKYREVLE